MSDNLFDVFVFSLQGFFLSILNLCSLWILSFGVLLFLLFYLYLTVLLEWYWIHRSSLGWLFCFFFNIWRMISCKSLDVLENSVVNPSGHGITILSGRPFIINLVFLFVLGPFRPVKFFLNFVNLYIKVTYEWKWNDNNTKFLEPLEINPMGKGYSSDCLHENMRKSIQKNR